jgi:hypothetical protein
MFNRKNNRRGYSSLDRLDNFGKTPWFFKAWFAFIFIAMVVGGYFAITHNNAMIKECMADGYKRYQCERMINPQEVVVTQSKF